jgi:hypothetical protein
MFRTMCVLVLVLALISGAQSFAGDPVRKATIDPGHLAQQYYQEKSAGQPSQNPVRTEAVSERFFTGAAANDQFGYSVASAGDVNGDGYSDVIVGAYHNDAGGIDAGRAYIFFGGISMDATVDVTLTGEVAADLFGWTVASAGDVNGDGYSDVIVGAPNNSHGGGLAGRAYIYFGGAAMDHTVDVTLTGEAAVDQFGYSVAGVGDVNGDGFGDVIVGACGNSAVGTAAGRAYIYFGGTSMDQVADVTLTGAAAHDNFGIWVASAGDVNGDGYGDAIVGAPYNDAGGDGAGSAYVYFGGTSMDHVADVTLTGAAAYDGFGISVAGAGDVNGDGYGDVIVGAQYNDAGGTNAGRAYICFGGTSMDHVPDVTLTGAAASDRFGYSVASAGDVNGDAYGDVIVGAYNNDAGGTNAGRAYIYFGGGVMDATADVNLTGAAASDLFGFSVAGAGDVNGDGYGDVIVGALYNDAGGTDAGRAYLYMNSMAGTDIPDERFTGSAPTSYLGYSVASAGDVNGDGHADVIVGAYGHDQDGANHGHAYIYYGGPGMDATADVTLTGAAEGDCFGWSVAGAGDVNGDGYSDVIVGAPHNDATGADAGAAYIYYGGASMDQTADKTLTGAAAGDQFGFSVASAGDVNGDRYSDMIVGAWSNDASGSDAGAAYIYYGGASMDQTADKILIGAAGGDEFGFSVAGAGDVNGDGYSDVIVGALYNASGGASAGRAYIYFGGASMDETADVTLTGEAVADCFGNSVAGAGDVNGDGYSDVIVGAYLKDVGTADAAGAAYIYYGGVSMDQTADKILTGAASADFFGWSVAGAGDVNGDGYSDVVVGAYSNEAGGINAGRAYVYFGGASMGQSADVTLTGAAAGDQFGISVAGAGDVNGDGYSDVIVGGPYNDAGGNNAGRAYLYLSSSPPVRPRIVSAVDVPFDQGGSVTVRWVRSGYDARGINGITSYQIERSRPPGVTGFAWELVATTPPRQNPIYEQTVATGYDSMTNNSGTYYFRVTARTNNSDGFWRSNIVACHSVDNLPPGGVGSLRATLASTTSVRLNWQENTSDADLGAYVLYRSTTNGFVPSESNRVAALADTTYLDASLPSAPILYYRIRAQDIHGNLGAPSPHAAISPLSTQTYAVAKTWNMISVPMTVSDFSKTTLYPTASSDAYAFASGYVERDVLANGVGYWLKFSSAQNVSLTGYALQTATIAVTTGWNMVGSIGVAVSVAQITSNPPGLTVSPFYGYASGYKEATTIEPHKGYWVKVAQAGQLILSAVGGTEGRVNIVDSRETPPDPPFLTAVTNEEVPTVFALEQNYPNPFNPKTEIRFGVASSGFVTLKVYDLLGREVATLVEDLRPAGAYSVTFDASSLASGVYLYRMQAGSFTDLKKLVVLK